MTRLVLVLIVSVATGCQRRGDPDRSSSAGAGSATTTTPTMPAALTSLDAAAAGGDAALVDHMRAHFAAVAELQRSLARGHLDAAKDRARWVVDHDEPNQLVAWAPYVADMKRAAREVIDAPDVPTAAALVAGLGRACSRCHEQTTAVVAFAWEEPPEARSDLVSQMTRHQWAAMRLWEGLVGPADDVWRQGAQVLATTQLDTAAAAGPTPRGDVAALAARVRSLAAKAETLEEQDDRAALYGELLSTCAGCHALVRPAPVPGR